MCDLSVARRKTRMASQPGFYCESDGKRIRCSMGKIVVKKENRCNAQVCCVPLHGNLFYGQKFIQLPFCHF